MLWKRRKRYINGYWMGDFEPAFQHALASTLHPGMTFFDVGANAGFYSLVAWEIVEEAMAGTPGILTFQTSTGGDSRGHLVNMETFPGDNPQGARFRKVKADTLDHLVTRYGKPDVIKVDIEGAE